MKATYKHLKEDWGRWQQGMNCPTDIIPPMFIYAYNCGLERGRLETIDENPGSTFSGIVFESEPDRVHQTWVPE